MAKGDDGQNLSRLDDGPRSTLDNQAGGGGKEQQRKAGGERAAQIELFVSGAKTESSSISRR